MDIVDLTDPHFVRPHPSLANRKQEEQDLETIRFERGCIKPNPQNEPGAQIEEIEASPLIADLRSLAQGGQVRPQGRDGAAPLRRRAAGESARCALAARTCLALVAWAKPNMRGVQDNLDQEWRCSSCLGTASTDMGFLPDVVVSGMVCDHEALAA